MVNNMTHKLLFFINFMVSRYLDTTMYWALPVLSFLYISILLTMHCIVVNCTLHIDTIQRVNSKSSMLTFAVFS